MQTNSHRLARAEEIASAALFLASDQSCYMTGEFFEVIVDDKTGRVAKTEPITGGDDLTAAKTQPEAMTKAKVSLSEVTKKASK